MSEAYLAVAGRIRRELQELDRVARRTQHIWQIAWTLTRLISS